jgi:hypothetical protein
VIRWRSPAVWLALLDDFLSGDRPVHLRCLDNPLGMEEPRLVVVKRAAGTRSILETGHDPWLRSIPPPRRAIRKAERAGVVIRPLACDELPALHQLRQAPQRQIPALAQPLTFFEALANRFSETDGWFPSAPSPEIA